MIWKFVALATITVLMGSSVVPAGAKDGLSDMATLAQDRMVIEDTLRRYVRALDDSDLDAYLATLTDDAKFVSAEGSYAGKEAIRRYVEPVMRSRKDDVLGSRVSLVFRTCSLRRNSLRVSARTFTDTPLPGAG